MSDTFLSKLVFNPFAGGNPRTELGKISDSNIKPGFAIRVSAGLIYLTKNSDKVFSGVMALKSGMAVDAVFTANDIAEYYPAGAGAIVWMYLLHVSAAVPVYKGQIMILSTTDGFIMQFLNYYSSDVDITDSIANAVGRIWDETAGHVTAEKLVKVILSV